MGRRPIAVVTAAVLMLEAVGIALLNWVLGLAVDRQRMSVGGLHTHTMTLVAWIAGAVFGLYLLGCGLVLLRCALRDRAPHGFSRVVLVTCAVVHCLLGAFAVGLAGWPAFALLMAVLALIVLNLVTYEGEGRAEASGTAETGGAPGEDPTPA
ncbi:hypothetical protein RKE29_26680 [Streptomyces sp. B1866]|uniref:hypothetical protein n=1 Tax=Streptomyces sp. B1866 TaxID=3075431 RepID=UPI00288F309F|nr:hypothetical protein [Streptomyces sp. B1866]MDT3400162.1 hypothetical protein [Streptomyces sp. B1866]